MSIVKRALIFCPGFFSYDLEIKKEFESNGFLVMLNNEVPFSGVFNRALVRLGFDNILKKQIERYYQSIFDEIESPIDILLIVNPECITPEILEKYRRKCKYIIVYMWDSFRNKPQAKKLIPCVSKFYTFDPKDASDYNLIFKPLFYSRDYVLTSHCGKDIYDLSFIGTVHSSRHEIAKKISESVFAYTFFYCPSKIVYVYKKYVLREINNVPYSDVSFEPLSRIQVVDIFKKSKCILDIAHPGQQGLTMRTIEALGAKRKIITTNANVVGYDFYDDSNILIYNNNISNRTISDFIGKDFKILDSDIYEKYSIRSWVSGFIRDIEL